MSPASIDAADVAAYWTAIAHADAHAATDVALGALRNGAPLLDILEVLVAAAQIEVGRRWAAAEWSVAQEHRATAVGEQVVATLAAAVPDPPPGRRAVVACADREWHALPPRLLSLALRDAGWEVTFLGPSVPVQFLAQLLQDVGPDLTALSCALPTRLFEAREVIETSRDAGIPIVVGGRGFGTDGRWAYPLGADAWAPDARAAVGLLAGDTLPAFTSPAPPLTLADDALGQLQRRREQIADDSIRAMAEALPDVARYDQRQQERTAEDVHHVLDFLAAALFVDDVTLFTDFTRWLAAILVARGVPARTLRAGLDIIAANVGGEPGPYARPLAFLAAGAREAAATYSASTSGSPNIFGALRT